MTPTTLTYYRPPTGLTTGADVSARDAWRPTGKYFPHCRPHVLSEVEKLRAYPVNWDGYGAPPFTPELIAAVQRFVQRLPDDVFIRPHRETACVPLAVVPMSSGAIQLEWHVGDRLLELEFETPGTIHYLKWWPREGVEEEGVYSVADARLSHRLIGWVLRGYDSE